MSRLRIVCKTQPPMALDGRFIINQSTGWQDVEVYTVADDGTETPLTNIESITWTAGYDGVRAVVTFLDAGCDVVADVADAAPEREPGRGKPSSEVTP